MVPAGLHGDGAAAGELHGVAEEVLQHLAEAERISRDPRGDLCGELDLEANAVRARLRLEERRDVGDERPHREGDLLELELPFFELREVEQLVDQRHHRVAAALNEPELLALLDVQRGVGEQLR